MAEEQDWKSLSTIDKIEHKNWNARVEGYKEALKEMNNARDSKDPLFNSYLGVMKKMVVDNNVVAQEKALEVVLYFVEEAHVAGKVVGELCTGLVAKCISSTRSNTKERGIAILKMLIEIEKHEAVIEELLKGLTNKTPKVVVGCITVLKESLNEFGTKIIPVKELFKALPQLLDDRDKGVRDAGKELIIEIYRWIGKAAMTPQMNNFKPLHVTDLNAEFEKLPTEKATPTRYLRSQKPKVLPQAKSVGGGNEVVQTGAVSAAADVAIDPYEFIDPVEVISKIPADFYDKIEEKKWTDRKDALDIIDKLTSHEKLVPGDFADLLKALLKVLSKDSNIVLVALAGKIIYQIAHGLRKKFSPYAVLTIQACLEKFKEKKANVVKVLRECIDAAYVSANLDSISEDVVNSLAHKTPNVRSETCLFLNRIFEKSTMETLPKKHLKTFIPNLVKLSQDSVPEVREASFQAIGTAMMVVTEKHIKPFTESIDSVKMARIMEFFEKAKADASQTTSKPVVSAPVKVVEPPKETKPMVQKAAVKKITGGAGGPKPQKKAAANIAEPEIPKESVLNDEDVVATATELFGEAFMVQIADKNFKERIAATLILQNFIKDKTLADLPSQLIVKLLLLKPGLKDNNVMVLKTKLELIKDIVVNGKFTWTIAELLFGDLTDKIGDIKNSDIVKNILTEMSDKLNLQCVANQVMKIAAENVNIKNLTESIVWISDAIKDFGFKIDMKDLLPFLRTGLQHTNPNVRQAALKLVGTISLYVRDLISTLLKDERSSIKQLIDQEVENMKSSEPPAPTRGLRNAKPKASGDDEVDAAESNPVHVEIDREELVPRENISAKITEEILTQLTDKGWKVKKDGFDEIIKITDKCTGILADGLQPLIAAVAKTANDSSKIISKIALSVLDTLCKLMTKKDADKFVKIVVPALFSACGDAKPKSREEAVTTLNTWVDKVGFPAIADGGMIVEAMKVDSPFQKAELLSWISPHLTAANKGLKKALPADFSSEMLPLVYLGLEERNPEVRKKAQEAVLPFMIVFGYEEMVKVHNKSTKAASKDNIQSYLDKAKALLPAPEVSKATVKGAATKPAAGKEAVPKKTDDTAVTKTKKEDPVNPKMPKGKVTTKEPESAKPDEIAPLLLKTINKKQRLLEDNKRKNLTKLELLQLVNTQFTGNCNLELMNNLFSQDFKKHIVAIDMLSRFVNEEDTNAIEATKMNLDLILKWIVVRFDETNTSVLNKGLEYLNLLFTILTKNEAFALQIQEATTFIPEIILKLSDKNVTTRANVMKILRLLLNAYPPKNIVPFIERIMFETKLAKVKEGCSELSQILIDEERIKVLEHEPLLIAIGKMIGERDNGIRNSALNCLVSAHNYIGERLHKILKELNDKDRSMLIERIKRTGKTLTSSSETGPTTTTTVTTAVATSVRASHDQAPVRELIQTKSNQASAQVKPAQYEMNPILKDEVSLKLINVEDDIRELLQPLEKITLHFSGRVSQSVSSNDAITAVIHSINSTDVKTSIQAMAQIDEVIKNQDVRSQLLTYMDNLVMSITMQLKATLGKLSEEHFIESEITDMFKGMLASLMSIFSHSDLATELNRDRLMNLLQVILRLVINDQLVALAEGCTIIRGINILSVRILESSNQTRMLSSLLRMMMDCLRNNDTNSKYLQLIFKCIWSMTKNLTNTVKSIDLVIILKDIQTFYTDFPPHVWEASHQDVPMRTVKTVVYSIINHRRCGVLEALYQIPNAPGKDLDQYIRKSYAKLHYPIPEVVPIAEPASPPPPAVASPPPRSLDSKTIKSTSRPYLDELKEIFQKIGNPSDNKEGLNDLFDFKIKNPHVDLSRYLNQTTPYFQRTIENGLRAISVERGQPTLSLSASTNALHTTGASMRAPGTSERPLDSMDYCDMDPDTLLRRLKQLRIKAGLDKDNVRATEVVPNSPLRDDMEVSVIGNLPSGGGSGDGPHQITAPITQNRRMSATDLNAFRQRINFYKNPR